MSLSAVVWLGTEVPILEQQTWESGIFTELDDPLWWLEGKKKLSLLSNFFVSKRCANIHLHYSLAYCNVSTWYLRLSILVWITWVLLMRFSCLHPISCFGFKAANGDSVHRSKPELVWTSPTPPMVSLHRSAPMHLHLLLMKIPEIPLPQLLQVS